MLYDLPVGRVLVLPTKAPSGDTPDTGRGKVAALAARLPGTEPIRVTVGDEVLYGKSTATEDNVAGKGYVIIRHSDIHAVL
ncbi:hypothetical protein [Streptomyces sp. NPDC048606]|uniref:hypothetical protein n=1 Tax=Streptomyces sp. NPDC048606 TaxID=3154726 RepID=UPI003444080E